MTRYAIPLVVFAALVALLGVGLTMDPSKVPSPLIDEPAPAFAVPELEAPERQFTQKRFRRHDVALFNVWASWCVACRKEHPLLMRLARRDEVPIYGLNYKDEREAALGWLERRGDPYRASAFDLEGQVGLDWGVYGVPETFVVDGDGVIRYKHVGPISEEDWREDIRPVVERLRRESG